MSELIRKCPKCKSERSPSEIRCENLVKGIPCGWILFNEPLVNPAAEQVVAEEVDRGESGPVTSQRVCVEGHPVEDDDIICLVCGSDIIEPGANDSTNYIGEVVEGWYIEEQIFQESESEDYFVVKGGGDDRKAFMILYKDNYEPDSTIYQTMERMDRDHLPDLILTGRWHNRSYEIHEWINYGSLVDTAFTGPTNIDALKEIIFEIAKALRDFAEVGLRHRDINPKTILLRQRQPLDLVITDFGSARLSDFDLDVISPLTLTQYSAPEAIVGAISAASDWWSLGMIVLEQVTNGECFRDVNEKAFLIHVVTRGVNLPDNLAPDIENLLNGLLAKDPLQRWQWEEVERWLKGEKVEPPQKLVSKDVDLGVPVILGEQRFFSPERFALAAAESSNWEEAEHLFVNGELFTWLKEHQYDSDKLALLNRLNARDDIEPQYKFALVLMVLNDALPLTQQGIIITPAWLTQNHREAYSLIFGPVPTILEEMSRETWLVSLKYRGEKVLDRAKVLEIDLDDFLYRQYSIISSRANLEAEEEILREAYPDTDHAGLSSLMMKPRLNEEDLIVLLCANRSQLTPLSFVVDEASKMAKRIGIESFSKPKTIEILRKHRRKISEILDERIKDFSRCGIEKIDDWADTFRIERRLSLQRILVLLSVDHHLWNPPERQQYKENIIRFFEKRVVNSVLRGPLVRLTVGKTSSRIDMTELYSGKNEAENLLNFVLDRSGTPCKIDPQIFSENIVLEQRLRRLINQAIAYRRDTGIDTMYLGFPFVLMKASSIEGRKPRIAPLLLWPVKISLEAAQAGNYTLSFDKDREEIRLNPALEGLLGAKQYEKYKSLRDELLSRSSIRLREVMEVMSETVADVGLTKHPSINLDVDPGHFEIISSAVIFNAKFVGQAISEDLRQLRQLPIENTALEVLLKVGGLSEEKESDPQASEAFFSVVKSDPSQDIAVKSARKSPGIVVEGPPGTGKSQTIVNIVADCIGRGESVLIVCQKQAALNVVKKRLEAENLEQRICGVIDINRDRQPVIKLIREQVESLFSAEAWGLTNAREERRDLIKKVDLIENKINSFEESIRAVDEQYKISYRDLICRLLEIEESGRNIVNVPELRNILESITGKELYKLQQECSSLSRDWIDSNYENSPFFGLKQFFVDNAVLESLKIRLETFREEELKREQILAKYPGSFDCNDVVTYSTWVKDAVTTFNKVTSVDIENINKWHELFFDSHGNSIELGSEIYEELINLKSDLEKPDRRTHDPVFFDPLREAQPRDLAKLLKCCESSLAPKSSFSFLNLLRLYRTKKIRRYIENLDGVFQEERLQNLKAAIELEIKVRPLRLRLLRVFTNLEGKGQKIQRANLSGLRVLLEETKDYLEKVIEVAELSDKCPHKNEAVGLFKHISIDAIKEFFAKMKAAIIIAKQRDICAKEIYGLREWFKDDWIEKKKQDILEHKILSKTLTKMLENMNTIQAFQAFRNRSLQSEKTVFTIFSSLRRYDEELRKTSSLQECISIIIKREAALAWKNNIERRHSSIMLSKEDLERLISDLETTCSDLLIANKKALAGDFDLNSMGARNDWESITRLRGPRTKKLREFMGLGNDLGLMKVRPVWLMNPEVVSQVLPLKSGLFDVVVFGEASQLLVDHSIPSLFRAKRVVISGDEKQMPPSSSFSRKMDADDEDVPEELDEDMSEAEASAIEEKWNQKEIKDCPDLLALGRASLPSTTLQIHYRSEYNALIEFSNYAFYSGQLNIPAKHPVSEIRKVKPVEVRHIGGIYLDQTNPEEAEAILGVLKELWLEKSEPPSIGVVTFNLKQAELIEGLIQLEATDNPVFAEIYARESDRLQGGEDMGFFVKNVENVQGDERDLILFSTTFGYNQHGSFRRNFGALGHKGGEKRLNVAVTRARKKVVILTSMPIEKISDGLAIGKKPNKPRDYLQAYLHYANQKSEGHIDLARRSAKQLSQVSESRLSDVNNIDAFVKSVQRSIEKFGYKSVSVNEGDAFGLDLAIEDPETGLFALGIECDAPQHTLLKKATAREIWRKSVLQRSVSNIHRISCFNWYQNREHEEGALKQIICETLNSNNSRLEK
ncbi:MAG: protein kinase domain-containing protein [Cellvibrionaceae bacterium]